MPSDSTTEKTNLVSIKNNKFDPKSVSVLSNSEVTFENLDKTPHTVAADPHPTHTSLPDLYLGPIYKNSPATYVFKIPGTYKVHLEDNPSSIGEIVVE